MTPFLSDPAGRVDGMRFGEQCQTLTCQEDGDTVTTVADGEQRWDLWLCSTHAEQVHDGDETHVLRVGGRPALALGPVLVCHVD